MNATNVSSEMPSGGYADMGVIIDGPDGSTASGKLLGVTARDFRVRFPATPGSTFEVGKHVRWRLTVSGVELQPSLHAEVVWRHDRGEGREYGLHHQLRDESLGHLPEWLRNLLEPRIAQRIRVRQALGVRMADTEGRWQVQGQLVDVSASGLGALFARSVEPAFRAVDTVRLELSLPGDPHPFLLVAAIRRRVVDARGFFYGFEIDRTKTPSVETTVARLHAFVTRELEQATQALLAQVGAQTTPAPGRA